MYISPLSVCFFVFFKYPTVSSINYAFIRSTLSTTRKLENQEAMHSLNMNMRETCTVSNPDISFFFKSLKWLGNSTPSLTAMKGRHSLSSHENYFYLKQQMLDVVHLFSFFCLFVFCSHHKFRCSEPIKCKTIWECVTLSCYKTPFVCVWACMTACQPYHTCVRSIFLFFYPVCVLHLCECDGAAHVGEERSVAVR